MRYLILLCCGLMFLATGCARTVYQPEQMTGYVKDEQRTVSTSDIGVTIDYDGGELIKVSLDDMSLDQPQQRRLMQYEKCWTVVHGPQDPDLFEMIFGIVEIPFAILEALLDATPSPGCRNSRTEWTDWRNYGLPMPAIKDPIAEVPMKVQVRETGLSKMLETNSCGLAAVSVADALGGNASGRNITISATAWHNGNEYSTKKSIATSDLYSKTGGRLAAVGNTEQDITALLNSGCKEMQADISTKKYQKARRTVAGLVPGVILDNSGSYMCPYTQDNTLADWTDMIISAKIGETAGGAVGTALGAYAGKELAEKALENVPLGSILGGFAGGMVGNKVGKEVGRNLGLEAAGGMENIRKTSDISFNSLDQMARYLFLKHSDNEHFQEAVKAACEIYPALRSSYDNAVANLSADQKSQYRAALGVLSNE